MRFALGFPSSQGTVQVHCLSSLCADRRAAAVLCCSRKPAGDGVDELPLVWSADLPFPSRAVSPPRAARETRRMSSCARNGLLLFLVCAASRCLCKFRLPPAHPGF